MPKSIPPKTRAIQGRGALMPSADFRLSNQLKRLYAIRDIATGLKRNRQGVPGSLLLELLIILPDVIEDLLELLHAQKVNR